MSTGSRIKSGMTTTASGMTTTASGMTTTASGMTTTPRRRRYIADV